MKKLFLLALFCLFFKVSFSQTAPLWLRYPAISPDGQTIAFGYKGDIYLVSANGGMAVPLTIHEAHDMMPVWSHDGKYIAFTSDRYGNFDVFVLPVTGGSPQRLTFSSANDYPFDFSADNKTVIFASAHAAPAASVRFPSPRLFQNLYSVPVHGGRPLLINAAGTEKARYNRSGTELVFEDRKGYEDPLRKHHISSVTRDIWIYNTQDKTYRKITDFAGEDREPVFSHNSDDIFYLSEKNGTLNIYKKSGPEYDPASSGNQLTTFKDYPVRHLSVSDNNLLCFTWNGEIYTMQENGAPKKVSIQIVNDGRSTVNKLLPVAGNISEFALNPNGKEVAIVSRGEIFVSSLEGSQTKRITNTPQQERMIRWSPDGKSLIYSAERNGSWDIYKTSILKKNEPYFYAATVLKEEPVIATPADEFQAKYSPDGKEIAYVEERNILKVYNIATGKTRTLLPEGHNHSYSDGDWDFQWSPDSKWILTDDSKGYFSISNAALIKADGTKDIMYPVNSGFGEQNSKWALNGKMFAWVSSKEGRKSLANQGKREVDIYGVFFDKESYDRFMLSKADYELLTEQEKKQTKDSAGTAPSKGKKKVKKVEPVVPVDKGFDFTDLQNRIVKLTINSASISDYVFNKDGSKLYYLAEFERGYDLWVTEPRTHDTRILAKLGGSPSGIELSQDEKTLLVSNNGNIVKVDAGNGQISQVGVNGEINVDPQAERSYIFDHAWRQVTKKFYDPKIHGVDWEKYKNGYAKFLPHISNNYDFQELLSELLGELNASHTGGRYFPQFVGTDKTASLGLLYDETYKGNGIRITEVISGGPLDKAGSKIKAGDIIEKIDGQPIAADTDWYSYLNRREDKNTLLSILSAKSGSRFDESVKPISISEENQLMYKRWVNKMQHLTDSLSNGKIEYVHVESMDDQSFRAVYDEVMGRGLDKKALIVDTRFNGGGWLHDDLNTFLSGKQYLRFAPQGNMLSGGEPLGRWQKPSCVLMNEGNYSDAYIFPYVYKQNGIGKLIGMPVAGTGTAVWWENQIDPTLIFGIPMVATIGKEQRPTENLQVEPDIEVPLPYNDFLKGKDPQLEAAVKEMLKEIGEGK